MPPTFLFLQYSIVKEPIPQTRYRGPLRFWLRGRQSVAHAALLEFDKGRLRSELLGRQRRAALVGEAYIVGASPKCQHRFRCFLNFLRHVREGAVQPGYVGSEAPFQLSLMGDGDRGRSIQAPAQLRPHSQTKPGTRIRRGSGSGGVRIVSRRRRGGNRAFVDLKRPGRQLSRPTNDNASPGETVLLNAGYRGNHRCAGRRAATDW